MRAATLPPERFSDLLGERVATWERQQVRETIRGIAERDATERDAAERCATEISDTTPKAER